jgi:Protein of unknown function (DUF3341)
MTETARPYGLFAAFDGPEALVAAARDLRERGYRALDAHASFPVNGLAEALGIGRSPVGWIIVAGIVFGAVATYALVLSSVTVAYPINVGGRPLHAWPPFLLLAFEGGVLGGALAALIGVLVLCRLPAYHHPAFDVPSVDFSDQRCFVLVVHGTDPRYDRATLMRLLTQAGATRIDEIAHQAEDGQGHPP